MVKYTPGGKAKTNPQKKKKPETAKTAKNPYASSTMSKFWAAKSSKRVQPMKSNLHPTAKTPKKTPKTKTLAIIDGLDQVSLISVEDA